MPLLLHVRETQYSLSLNKRGSSLKNDAEHLCRTEGVVPFLFYPSAVETEEGASVRFELEN